MLINDNKGSYGMFSRTGRNTADKFHILMKKDEILNGTARKFKPPDLFSKAQDEANKYHSDNLQHLQQVFLDDHIEHNKQKESKKKKFDKIPAYKKSDSDMEKFLDIRNKNKRLNQVPCFNRYNPKNEFIWKNSKQIPGWESTVHKNKSKKKKEFLIPKFYIEHNFEIEGRNFVEMDKQLKRKSFINVIQEEFLETNLSNFNVRSNYSENKGLKSARISYNKNNLNNYGDMDYDHNKKYDKMGMTMNSINPFKRNESNKYLNDPSPSRKSISSLLKAKNNKNFNNLRNSRTAHPSSTNNRNWYKIQAPDFKKIISREDLEKINNDKRRIIPFTIPSCVATRPRSIMLVKYNSNSYKPKVQKRPSSTPSLEVNFDPYKLLDKVNNHKKPSTPNFATMTSRPEDKILPSYMQRLYSRQGANLVTDKALKMNKFSDGKFSQTQTCFWPKKSYNKIVNLNLLSSKKFVENVGLNQEMNKGKLNEINDYIQKSMKFYSKII